MHVGEWKLKRLAWNLIKIRKSGNVEEMVISPPPPLGSFTSQLIGPMENLFEDCQQNHWKEKNFRLKQVEWQLTLFHISDWYQINSNGLYNWCFQEAVLQEDKELTKKNANGCSNENSLKSERGVLQTVSVRADCFQ